MNLITPTFAAVLIAGAAPDSAAAQTPDCASASSQTDMTICAEQALKSSDAALNRAYNTVMARLTPPGKTALRDAQRAWITFRDKECFFESNGKDGGSISPMIVANCAQSLTDTRTADLVKFKVC